MNQSSAARNQAIGSPVLELRRVSQASDFESSLGLDELSLTVRSGELLTIEVEPSTRTRSFASLLQGICEPDSGGVIFLQHDWRGYDYQRHFFHRSLIGRVFEGKAWIENLNLDENVTLASRHHGKSKIEITESVQYWLDKLGLEKLTSRRPAFVAPAILQLHQWIRAFISCAKLLILERPLQFLGERWVNKLLDAIQDFLKMGSAVLWLDSRSEMQTIAGQIPHLHLIAESGMLRGSSKMEGGRR